MDRVFNMGIGLVLVVAEYYADAIVRHLNQRGPDARPGSSARSFPATGTSSGMSPIVWRTSVR